ncbi:choice-of-anchor D domain-containing protein [Vulgatibacter incomptus]|uniref:Abnormal spindle-like microcephaly-associated protein ASH domain-containing protein n=1 Tax=Vulgatibacter incomptus TaxID=1391653 RepID=A0A0K1PEK3_9BACT|nr:choice-of-anchor D domain-containing protein [Vulgatibacter incomptus]AKU91554.1 hypothetical protein AKJ08_1941 [Vulgatibacter incomptus]
MADPDSIDFAQVFVGTEASKLVTLSNLGRSVVRVRASNLPTGYDMRPSEVTLSPGAKAEVKVAFFPLREERFDGQLELSLSNAKNDVLTMDLRGEGVKRVVEVVEVLDFGTIKVGDTKTLPLDLTNLVEKDLNLALSITGGSDRTAFRLDNEAVELELPGGTTRALDVSFTPANRGPHAASLLLRPCPSCQDVRVQLIGSGGTTDLRPSPPTVSLGTVTPTQSKSAFFTIQNVGDFSATVTSVALVGDPERDPANEGEAPGEFSLDGVASTFEVEAGASVPVTVVFDAADVAQPRKFARVRVMGPDDRLYFEVPVDGKSGGIDVEADPKTLDFGRQPKNFAAKLSFVLKNVGEQVALTVERPFISGLNADSYTVAAADGTQPPWTLDGPKGFEVTFRGSELQDYPAALEFPLYVNGAQSAEMPYATVDLMATVVELPPCDLDISPASLRFGAVTVNKGVSLPIDIKNQGTTECLVWNVGLDPDGHRSFSSPDLPTTPSKVLAPGEKFTVGIRYAPTRITGVVDRSNLFFNHSNVETPRAVVAISGLATAFDLVADPNPVVFGPVPAVPQSLQVFKPFLIRNRGVDAVRVSRVSMASGYSQRFTVRADETLPVAIPSQGSKSFLSSYKPLDLVQDVGKIEVWLQGVDEPFLVETRGSGTDEDCGVLCQWPTAICPATGQSVTVNTQVVLSGGAYSPGGHATTCTWSVVSAPVGSSARPNPVTGCTPAFIPDLVGNYVFELMVTDALGNRGACQHSLAATPWGGLWVETFWDVAGDIDLHVLNEALGNRQTQASWWTNAECYYGNCQRGNLPTPLWDGDVNSTASLDRDDIPGTGPENTRINSPSLTHPYAVGIHNFGNSRNPVNVTTNIYCGGQLAHNATTVFTATKQFEVVGSVQYNGSTCVFTPDGTRWTGFH